MKHSRPVDRLLPASLAGRQISYRVGLVSDTHAPQRLAHLPRGLFEALEGVDLLLHAGDVGELWVLDQLSRIAPVVAVHGNDDTQDATDILPYTQIVVVKGTRILVWHSHYPRLEDEIASRQDDGMVPKLERIGVHGRTYGAQVVVFGHWHIPLCYRSGDVLLVNPGAVASGNELTRQLQQTAAVLFFDGDNRPHPVHVNLEEPAAPHTTRADFEAGFNALAQDYNASILDEGLMPPLLKLRSQLTRADVLRVRDAILPLAHRVWSGELGAMDRTAMVEQIETAPMLPDHLRMRVLEVLRGE